MATIDERPEDIYTEVKKTPKLNKYKVRFTDKTKSKSLGDLSGCWPTSRSESGPRKANTLEDLANNEIMGQMEALYTDVALAYMQANLMRGNQPPQLADFLRVRCAELAASSSTSTATTATTGTQPDKSPSTPPAQPLYNSSSSHAWALANPLLDSSPAAPVNPADYDDDDEDYDDDNDDDHVYTTHIDAYRPYQTVASPQSNQNDVYAQLTSQNSTMRSYESICTEHMLAAATTDTASGHDVPL